MVTTKKATNTDTDSSMSEKASAAAHEALDKVTDTAMHAEETLRSVAASSAESLAEGREHAQLQFESSVAKARVLVAENPLAAAGIAFAAGIIVSNFLQKRS